MIKAHPTAIFQITDFRLFLSSVALASLANRVLVVVIGYQVYKLTKSPLALGWLGLMEAIPAISLSLIGGYVADHYNRRKILLVTKLIAAVCVAILGLISLETKQTSVLALYVIIFIAGLARGFSDPAHSAFEAQIVPAKLTVNASSWLGSTWISASIIGPAMAGFAYALWGPQTIYFVLCFLYLASLACIIFIPPYPTPKPKIQESVLKSIKLGIKFVFNEQPLVGSMALDLFAVLFGGAMALLPIFADDILHVGPQGLGLLNAAPALGALMVMLWSTHRPPIKHAGKNLLLCVTGFGLSMIVFALSKNFILSLIALTLSGAFDGVSMVIRRSIVRLLSPDDMRGRVASVSLIFIGASNEIGAFESGIAAHFLGAVNSVWMGGVVTLLIVGATALWAPKLRRLSLVSEINR